MIGGVDMRLVLFVAGCLLMGVTAYIIAWSWTHERLVNAMTKRGIGYGDACLYTSGLLLFLTGAGFAYAGWRLM